MPGSRRACRRVQRCGSRGAGASRSRSERVAGGEGAWAEPESVSGVGNQAMQHLLNAPSIQTKTSIGRPGDRFEQEADRVANHVLAQSTPGACALSETGGLIPAGTLETSCSAAEGLVQRQESGEKDEEEEVTVAAKETPGSTPVASPGVERSIRRLPNEGRPLPQSERDFFEPRFGRDFGNVRIHDDAKSAELSSSLQARAFTVGGDIVFNRGEYAPSSASGRHLLAHELTHVIQQQGSPGGAMLQRWKYGTGAGPLGHYVPVPDDEKKRVGRALNIVKRVVDNPKHYPRCHKRFQSLCTTPSPTELADRFKAAVIWKRNKYDATFYFGGSVPPDHIAYTAVTYRWGRWMIASTVVHEMMHRCGQDNEAKNLRTEKICGFPGTP